MNRRTFLRGLAAQRAEALASSTPLRPLNVQAGLEPYAEPLDARRARHLLRRTGFGARPAEVDALTGLSATDVVNDLVDAALLSPLPDPPTWADAAPPGRGASDAERQQYQQDNAYWMRELRSDWLARLSHLGLHEKLTLFWHNHFVTEARVYYFAPFAHRYLTLLRTHALGNFRDFVRTVGIDPAMLIYLNGNTNTAEEPNENYGRELLELFTMSPEDSQGNANYTQQDIEEIARALTGWVVDPRTLSVHFIPLFHDVEAKTIFGQTGAFGYDGVVDLIFDERAEAVAQFVCAKLYREFIYAAPDEGVVAEMALLFLVNDFEIAPVVRALLKSAHFFDAQVIGAQIKSPVAKLAAMAHDLVFDELPPEVYEVLDRFAFFLQQPLLNPPNVAGWEGHHSWISTTTLPIRWLISDFLLFGDNGERPIDLLPLAEQLHDPADPLAAFTLPAAVAAHLLPIPLEDLKLDAPNDFGGDLVNNPIPDEIVNGPAHVRDLAKIFLAGLPWYDWSLYRQEAPILLLLFARQLTQLPEFQLT